MKYRYTIIEKDLAGRASDYFYVRKYELTGDYVPADLPETDLSDIYLIDEANNVIYITEWVSLFPPRVRIWKIDGNRKTHNVSREIDGICAKMLLDGSDLVLSVFTLVDENADYRHKYGFVTIRPKF